MRSNRTLIMLGLALLAGLLAAWLSVRWMNSQVSSRAQAASANLKKVAVAAEDLRAGREVNEKSVHLIDWPVGSVPPGAISELSEVLGRVVKSPLGKGEPILDSKLAAKGTRGGLAGLLAPGKRAISVGVNDVVGVTAESLEGSYVDIMVNTTDSRDADRQRSISKIVLERVKILALPQTQTGGGRINAVTLEVSPAEAEKVDLARSVGTLSIVLRAQDDSGADVATPVSRGATKDALFGGSVRAAPPAAPRAVQREAPQPSVAPVATPVVSPVPAKAPEKPRVCVDAYVGSERRTECF